MMTKFERIVREKCGTYLYSLKYVRSLDVILDLTLFDIAIPKVSSGLKPL